MYIDNFYFLQTLCLQECECKCDQLMKELETEKVEKGRLEEEVLELQKLRVEISEQSKLVASLKQACAVSSLMEISHCKKLRSRVSE